ncbi:MAG TPA: restriction endonuclease subunit S [Thermoanaerobaculia bacterium]|nr:restriction endonuclease subunit S [Thermoanaerobaculia bacterium]
MTSVISDWTIGRREGELPEGWTEATLEEIVVHALGGEWGEDPKVADEDGGFVRVRVIRGTDFRSWKRSRATHAELRAIKKTSLEKRRLAAGDLVVEISGGGASQPVGRTLRIDEAALQSSAEPLVCSNFCRQIRIHSEVNAAYVHLVLTHQYLCGGFDEYQTQTTNLRNLNFQDFLSRVVIPLPPRSEQERIVARVEELMAPLDRSREGLARVPQIVRRFRQAVLAAAYSGRLTEDWRAEQPAGEPFTRTMERVFALRRQAYVQECREAEAFERRAPRKPKNLTRTEWEAPDPLEAPEVPEGWSLVALQDVIHRKQYGTSVKAESGAGTGVPVLRMSNIRDGKVDLSDLKHIRPESEDIAHYTLRRGDILFNRTNSPELVGKAAVFDDDRLAVFASYLIRIECDDRLVSSRYVCGWINSPWGRWWARTVRTDCVSQSNINSSKLLAMPVPVPPLTEQHEIVRQSEEHFAFADAVEQRVAAAGERIEQLMRTVLTRALRGELVPSEEDPDGGSFEPASDLVDRIRAERLAPSQPGEGSGPVPRSDKREVSAEILAAIRQSCWGAGVLSREDLIKRVAFRLGCPTFGKSVRARIDRHLRIAVTRRIVDLEGELLRGATPTFRGYDFQYLIRTARSLMQPGVRYDRAEIVRAVAGSLGYSQITVAIRERMDRVFQWADQCGELRVDGEKVWWER